VQHLCPLLVPSLIAVVCSVACGGEPASSPPGRTTPEPSASVTPTDPAAENLFVDRGSVDLPGADPLATLPFWAERAPFLDSLTRSPRFSVEEHWHVAETEPEGALIGVRIKTRSDDREGDLASASSYLSEHGRDARESVSRTDISVMMGTWTVAARTPGFFPGDFWVSVDGQVEASVVRRACLADGVWASELEALDGWRDGLSGCSRTRALGEPTRRSIEFTMATDTVDEWRVGEGFVTEEACALARCWSRTEEPPARVRVGENGETTLSLWPLPEP